MIFRVDITRRRSGFTLVELVISSALMSIILVAGYLCLSAGVSSEELLSTRSDAVQSARVALNLMSADLRSAVPLWKEFEFVGMRRKLGEIDADNIDFGTRNFSPSNPGEMDFCETSYFLQQETNANTYILFRRRDSTPDPEPLSGGRTEEIARGVHGLRIEYYDGWDWWDEWGDPEGKQRFAAFPDPNVSGLPEAVRITLSVDPEFEKRGAGAEENGTVAPLVFQTVARVNLATWFYQRSNSSQSSSAEEGAGTPSNQQGGMPQ